MSITPIFNSLLSTYSGTRSLFADRMGAQRATSTSEIPKDDNTKALGATDNVGQFLADKASKISETESVTNQGEKTGSGASRNDKDAGKAKSPSGDVLDLSEKAQNLSEDSEGTGESQKTNQSSSLQASTSGEELTEEEQAQVVELKARDAEVRTHEAAHIAAAGPYANGGASYTYQTGPDGQKYAIGGEVSIDSGAIKGDPEATIQKARQVQAAALAPAQPSSQDYKVAAAASQMMAQAQMELSQQRSAEMSDQTSDSEENSSNESLKTETKSESGNVSGTNESEESDTQTASGPPEPGPENLSKDKSENQSVKEESKTEDNSSFASSTVATSKLSSATNQYRMQSVMHSISTGFGQFQAIG